MKKVKLLDRNEIEQMLKRLACEIIESNTDLDKLAIVGIRTRGDVLAKRIIEIIEKKVNKTIKKGTLDVTFYRDDFSSNWGSPKVGPSDLSFDVDKKNIVLIDDVLFTGRTIRAAIEEIFSFGRPASIHLGVLVDRGHRELPIKANFVGKNFPTSDDEHIHVYVEEIDNSEEICLKKY